MDTNKILNADILDILFEGRNKQYGAYELRKTYNRRMGRALITTAGLAILVFAGTVFANSVSHDNSNDVDVLDTQLAQIRDEPTPPPIEIPPPVKQTPPPLNQIQFTPPVIKPDDQVTPEDQIQDIQDDQVISNKTIVSDNKEPVVQAPVEDVNSNVVDVKKSDDENKIWIKVEKEAEFPGGEGAWRSYLMKTLNGNVPVDNGAGEGTYTVIVKFVVSKDGSLSEISCENDPGFGMCQEAVRVIRKTKNWTPALQNGNHVNAYRRQPITFQVEAN